MSTFNWETFTKSALRRSFRRTPMYYNTLNNARRNKPEDKEGRHRFEFKCAMCGDWFPQKQVQVDHIHPIAMSLTLIEWIIKLFTGECQVLCIKDHKEKSKQDLLNIKEWKEANGIRRKTPTKRGSKKVKRKPRTRSKSKSRQHEVRQRRNTRR